MKPACHAATFNATVRSRAPSGARSIGRARLTAIRKARAVPNATTKPYMGSTDVGSVAT